MDISCCDLNGVPIKYFYQWDLDQKMVVWGLDMTPIPEFHFCNVGSDCALVVVPEVDGERLIVSVPNILLQKSGSIVVYIYAEDILTGSRTTRSISIPVKPRIKPCDYVFSENITYKNELVDIRTGWDGTVYNSAGDAVRALGSQKLDKAPIPMANEEDTQEIHRTKEGLLVTKPSSGGGGPLIKDAKIGQLIRAKAVDETGNITEYEPVPFMYEDAQETVIFPEQTVNGFIMGEGLPVWLIDNDPTGVAETFLIGDKYKVAWDKTTYDLTCKTDAYKDVWIGNLSLINSLTGASFEDTGEPFVLVQTPPPPTGLGTLWTTNQSGPSHTIGISTITSNSKPVPSKFMPYNGIGENAEAFNGVAPDKASGKSSHAEGYNTLASGDSAHAEGYESNAIGRYSHTENLGEYHKFANVTVSNTRVEEKRFDIAIDISKIKLPYVAILYQDNVEKVSMLVKEVKAKGDVSTFVGYTRPTGLTDGIYDLVLSKGVATREAAHVEGTKTIANARHAHTEGDKTIVTGAVEKDGTPIGTGIAGHAEGTETMVYGENGHAEGFRTIALGISSHSGGVETTASGEASHAEGFKTTASRKASHAEGKETTASGYCAHAEGSSTAASGYFAHAESESTIASGEASHAEGYDTTASSVSAHAEGSSTTASGEASHAEGLRTTAFGENSHAEGFETNAFGNGSHVEGMETTTSNGAAHAEGIKTTASGVDAHAEGYLTTASSENSHAEGFKTTASGNNAHAEGSNTTASGYEAHAEGTYTTASGDEAHAEGGKTIASGIYQHVQGKYNIPDTVDGTEAGTPNNKYAHIVGNGAFDALSNAHTLDWNGNSWYQGRVLVGGADMDAPDAELTPKSVIITSSTPDSVKRFKITVDDTGVIEAKDESSNAVSMAVPIPTTADEGAILQVVNGNPKWVKLTNRAEVGG